MGLSAHIPTRTCVGCRKRDGQRALVRVARVAGRPRVDHDRRLGGRGSYVHRECVERALKTGGIARGLRIPMDSSIAEELRASWPISSLQEKGEHDK